MAQRQIALISLSDKTGLHDLATQLDALDIDLIASGGTYKEILTVAKVTEIKDVTKHAEMIQGRVKTLHPAIHAGILSTDSSGDQKDMAEHGYSNINFVFCNLYPFEKTIAAGGSVEAAVEEIDIGGVTLLRAAAKNHQRVLIISDPSDYQSILGELSISHSKTGIASVSEETRRKYALKAFTRTAEYDTCIQKYFQKEFSSDSMMSLRYGANPHQKPARVFSNTSLPFKVLGGSPGYINLLDALNAWPLVKELKEALNIPAATSFKHVSPAGVAIGLPLTEAEKIMYGVDDLSDLSPLASAYARARGADRMSSFGDWIALSDVCDLQTARIINREVSDGIIAPGYEPEALALLNKKKKGRYTILQIDPDYEPPELETRQVYGLNLEQRRNNLKISDKLFTNIVSKQSKTLSAEVIRDLIVANIALKYTQSNSVCYAKNGQVVGLGAGQQSRIHCTRLAGDKAENWRLRQHPLVLGLKFASKVKRAEKANAIDQYVTKVSDPDHFNSLFDTTPPSFTDEMKREWISKMSGLVCASDAFFPFPDNIDRVYQSGVQVVCAPGGSVMDDVVVSKCESYGIDMVMTEFRLFHH